MSAKGTGWIKQGSRSRGCQVFSLMQVNNETRIYSPKSWGKSIRLQDKSNIIHTAIIPLVEGLGGGVRENNLYRSLGADRQTPASCSSGTTSTAASSSRHSVASERVGGEWVAWRGQMAGLRRG
jgi:hypothetical protein